MMYRRSGKCNMCGECCGYPKPDGTQNNAWPSDWPESLELAEEHLLEYHPLFRIVQKNKKSGVFKAGGRPLPWMWVKGMGLCKQVYKNGMWVPDQRCPFLSDKKEDGTVPCLLYGSLDNHVIWKGCDLTPIELMTQVQMDEWNKNCPSCSFEWTAEE